MQASPIVYRLRRYMVVREWAWWNLPPVLRWYVATPPALAVAALSVEAADTKWSELDLFKFLILLCCGIISVGSTPKVIYAYPGLTRDFGAVWVLPAAILLPPIYAALMPIPMFAVMWWYVHRGVLHRTVFTCSSISLTYAFASYIFRLFPSTFAGGDVGSGLHALTWVVTVGACNLIGSRGHHFLIVGAVKLSNPKVRVRDIELNPQALQGDFVEIDLGVLITLAVALTPALVVLAIPTVLLVRRFIVYPVIAAQSRIDAKTGLLNVSTWESEVKGELARATRMHTPLAIALVDIDHFKKVNDTYGHMVGDKVLKAIANALTSQSRDYDRVGRFGGEEFVLLLAQTTESDARKIAERLRTYVAGIRVPIDDRPDAPTIAVTISIGVTAVAKGEDRELADLLAAADSALYYAKQSGRNRVAVADPDRDSGLDAHSAAGGGAESPAHPQDATRHLITGTSYPTAQHRVRNPLGAHRVELVQADQTAVSLCPATSLSVPMTRPDEFGGHPARYLEGPNGSRDSSPHGRLMAGKVNTTGLTCGTAMAS